MDDEGIEGIDETWGCSDDGMDGIVRPKERIETAKVCQSD